jgi:hypothetical protein
MAAVRTRFIGGDDGRRVDVDPESLKNLVRKWVDALKLIETELLAHVSALELLKKGDPEFVTGLLEKARKSPKVHEVVNKKYDAYLHLMLQHIEKGSLDQALSRFLRDWKPERPVN